MKSSSVAPRLKQEQVDGSRLQEGLELRLGISSDNGLSDGGATSSWLGVGVHPWSLAARQENSALEQAHQRPSDTDCAAAAQRESRPSSSSAAAPQLVGWPPVRAFRKNLSAPRATDAEEPSKVKPCSGEGAAADERTPSSAMFVKVNLEGYAVGRKVDLAAHRSYASLSRALQSMFHGFLQSDDGHGRIASTGDDDDEHLQQQQVVEKGGKNNKKKEYILVYEDNEGDRMLVGDVPWELFIASVKRLYIAQDPRVHANHQ